MTRNAREDCRDSCDRARPTTCTSWVCRLPLDMPQEISQGYPDHHDTLPNTVWQSCKGPTAPTVLPTTCIFSRHVLASCIKGNNSDWS